MKIKRKQDPPTCPCYTTLVCTTPCEISISRAQILVWHSRILPTKPRPVSSIGGSRKIVWYAPGCSPRKIHSWVHTFRSTLRGASSSFNIIWRVISFLFLHRHPPFFRILFTFWLVNYKICCRDKLHQAFTRGAALPLQRFPPRHASQSSTCRTLWDTDFAGIKSSENSCSDDVSIQIQKSGRVEGTCRRVMFPLHFHMCVHVVKTQKPWR